MWTSINWLEAGRKAIVSAPPGGRSASKHAAPRQAVPAPGTAPTPKKRRWRRVARDLYWSLCLICLTLTGYYVNAYRSEQQWLRTKAAEIVDSARATTNSEEVLALRDYVRKNVRYEGVDQFDRPFLRASAQETLESGRGYCGEATRAFICLARQRGISAQRVNLYGPINHVVAEVQTGPDREVLVDVQDSPLTNSLLDCQEWTVHEIDSDPRSPFTDYSNVHLRRLPLVGQYVHYVKLRQTFLTWVLENPSLLKAVVVGGVALGMIVLFCLDRVLVRLYAWRFGIKTARSR